MLRDQVRMTSKKGWLSQLQLEKIRNLQKVMKIVLKLSKRNKIEQALNLYKMKKQERETILEKNNRVKYKCTSQRW